MDKSRAIKPMHLWQTLLFFGIPAVYFYFSIYAILPKLAKSGIAPILNYSITLMGPVILLFAASLIAFKLEGNEFKWNQLKERFRLKPLKTCECFWTLGLSAFMIITGSALVFTRKWLLTIPFFSPPDYLPSTLDPRVVVNGIPSEFSSIPVWGLVVYQILFLLFNIIGEEFWWRGYILPRQEMVHGKFTWIIHGILWTLFHFFWKWNLLILLPGALAVSFVAQRLKNTTVIVVVHLILNTIGSTLLLMLNNLLL